ncbi:MAG TPA: hypothetical protein VHA07_14905 [Devosia sp.]|nr:hypothetical protein [Devosia sp.]
MKFFAVVLILSLLIFGLLLYWFTYVPDQANTLQLAFPEVATYLKGFLNLYVPLLLAALCGIGGGAARYFYDRRANPRAKPHDALAGAVYAFFGFALIVGGASVSFAGLPTTSVNLPAAISYGALFGFLGRNLLALFDLSSAASTG